MKRNFKKALKHVLVHEGGWADHPKDPGGATMKGITLATYRRHFGEDKSKDDLRNITDEDLGQIYRSGYWSKCRCNELPAGVDYAVFDGAVNSGPGRGAKWLQAALGAKQDGGIGPKTLSRVEEHDPIACCERGNLVGIGALKKREQASFFEKKRVWKFCLDTRHPRCYLLVFVTPVAKVLDDGKPRSSGIVFCVRRILKNHTEDQLKVCCTAWGYRRLQR